MMSGMFDSMMLIVFCYYGNVVIFICRLESIEFVRLKMKLGFEVVFSDGNS